MMGQVVQMSELSDGITPSCTRMHIQILAAPAHYPAYLTPVLPGVCNAGSAIGAYESHVGCFAFYTFKVHSTFGAEWHDDLA